MAFGLQLSSDAGKKLISTETYNMHYLGRGNHFQTLRIQSHPPSQYDNFYIESEVAPMPFIVQRPGIHAAVLGVQRDANNPKIWNITVLSSGIAMNYRYPASDEAWKYWPNIKSYEDDIIGSSSYIGTYTAAYNFSLVNDTPPQVLCFAKLPSFAALANPSAFGMAIYEQGGSGIAFDSERYPLDPYYIGSASIPDPSFYASNSAGSSGPYVEGWVFQKRLDLDGVDRGRHGAFGMWMPSGSADTYIGALPAQPAMFFSSRAECFAAIGNGTANIYPNLGQSCVPVASIVNGTTVHVEWGVRGAIVDEQNTWPNPAYWVKNEPSTPVIIIDAARYP